MRQLIRTTLASLVLVMPALAGASMWEIDPAHSAANFAVKHLVISTVRGTMGTVTGTVNLDESDPTKSTVMATVDVKGLDTRDEKRDEHLRGPDFFDVAKYPTITFMSKKIQKVSDTKYKVTGELTMHGVSKDITLDVTGSPKPMKDPFGNTKLGGTATTKLNRQDFGIAWSKALDGGGLVVGDEVEVTVDLELIQKN